MCKLKTWTVDEMLGEHPCKEYDKKKLTELWAGKPKLSMLDILSLNIPNEDKIWVACLPKAITGRQQKIWISRVSTRNYNNNVIDSRLSSAYITNDSSRNLLSMMVGAARTAAENSVKDMTGYEVPNIEFSRRVWDASIQAYKDKRAAQVLDIQTILLKDRRKK